MRILNKRLFSATAATAAMAVVMPCLAGPAQGRTDSGAEHRSVVRLSGPTVGTMLTAGLKGSTGAAVGPDGALYVTEGGRGRITRVDTAKGRTSTYATGFPQSLIPGLGGVIDVAFVGNTAYALVSAVNADFGGKAVAGLYRRDSEGHFIVVADLAAYSATHLPATPFDLPGGLQFSLQPVPGGILVTDGHHNRILHVTSAGVITQRIQLENVVPTGMAVHAGNVFVAQLGPVPHAPAAGRVTTFALNDPRATPRAVASGASMLIDVEFAANGTMYALSQGAAPDGANPGDPATPNTGTLLRVQPDGTMVVIARSLDRPTSLDFSGDTAFITNLAGEVWKLTNVSKLG